jgi:hypothetical protein
MALLRARPWLAASAATAALFSAVRLAPADEADARAGGVLAAAFAALAVLALLGAGIAWRTHRRERAL